MAHIFLLCCCCVCCVLLWWCGVGVVVMGGLYVRACSEPSRTPLLTHTHTPSTHNTTTQQGNTQHTQAETHALSLPLLFVSSPSVAWLLFRLCPSPLSAPGPSAPP